MITAQNTKTIYDLVQSAGTKYADRVFLRYEENESLVDRTYQTFARDCNTISVWIKEQNKLHEHKIHAALFGKNSYQYIAALLGITSAGSIVIALDVQLEQETLEECLERSDADIIFYDWEQRDKIETIKAKNSKIKEFVCFQSGHQEICIHDIIDQYQGREFVSEVTPEECAIIIFTSGTTGNSKGVMLSHENLIDNAFSLKQEEECREIFLNVLPIHHVYCINDDVLMVIRCGDTLCLGGDISKLLYYIQLYQPSIMRMVPMVAKVLYNKMAAVSAQNPQWSEKKVKESVLGKRLDKIYSGGAYLSEDLAQNLLKYDIAVGQGYGMSECSPKIAVSDIKRVDKLASVGKLVEGCQVRIIDGEIQVKSASVMMGYYKDDEKTAEVMTLDGWLKTGDLGYLDDENFLFLTGRKKNLIILSNGENVSPEEIENQFESERLISEIIIYENEDTLAAEIFPNHEYASYMNIKDVFGQLQGIIKKHNQLQPSYKKIVQISFREQPFEKTASKKIIRGRVMAPKRKENMESYKKPENAMQQEIYNCIVEILGKSSFGTNSDIYEMGLDSLGSIMLIAELSERMEESITFNDLMEHNTVIKLESFFKEQKNKKQSDFEIREVYHLSKMQMYFAYVIKGHTTGNMPFTFRLDNEVDLERLKQAIEKTIDVHPGLKAVIKFHENEYKIFRDDNKKADIPIIELTEEEWEEKKKTLLVPYEYTAEDTMYHISICQTEKAKYLFFDIAHIMGDGITMNILFEDMNRLYRGEKVEKEEYTYYEYILDEEKREEIGIRQQNLQYFDQLLKNYKMQTSILNKKQIEDYSSGKNAVIKKEFEMINREKVTSFCKLNGISENVLFLTAFNYCISLFSNEEDVISTSIHSGRTDNRWTRIAGPLFMTYYFRYLQDGQDSVMELLHNSGKQIMNTMRCNVSNTRAGEMFIQYQGEYLNIQKIGDKNAEYIKMQLDSLPFHLQIMKNKKGYYMELRYWENRFDKEQLDIFIACYENILEAMHRETSIARLAEYLPEQYFPENINRSGEICILDKNLKKKPYGAWGTCYILNQKPVEYVREIKNPFGEGNLYEINRTARILADGSVDDKENSGKIVMTDGIIGRKFFDLTKLEQIITKYKGIDYVKAYISYSIELNDMMLTADIKSDQDINMEHLKEFIEEKSQKSLVPWKINII